MNISRRNFLRSIFYGSIGIGLIKGLHEIDNYDVTSHIIKNPNIKTPLRLIHLTDMHFQADNLKKVKELSSIINQLNPNIIAMTGDYLKVEDEGAKIDREIEIFDEFVNQLSCSEIYSCTGNWDIGYEKQLFENNKAKNLANSTLERRINGNVINITGLTYGETLRNNLISNLTKNQFNLTLVHSPDAIQQMPLETNPNLILAGHTHGGHIRIPYYGAIYVPCETGKKYEAGLYELKENQLLYVSRGLGESIIPIRINCRPEIALFKILPS